MRFKAPTSAADPLFVDPSEPRDVVDLSERARRASIQRAWRWVAVVCGIAFSYGQLDSASEVLSALMIGTATFCLVLALIEFLVRPKRVDVAGVTRTGFFALLPLVSPGRAVSVAGRLIFGSDGVTWMPGGQARAFGSEVTHWTRRDIDELRVQRVQNLTPLGYLHVSATDSSEAVFRVFQPKSLRRLTEALVPLVPPETGHRANT